MTGSQIQEIQLLQAGPVLGQESCWLVALVGEQGTRGYGEIGSGPEAEVREAVEALAPLLLGRSAGDREALWLGMTSAAAEWEGDLVLNAGVVAGLDTAAWDLVGTASGLPGTVLMGGRTRTRLEVCVECGPIIADTAVTSARALKELGVRTFSFAVNPACEADCERLRQARKLLGAEALIAVDVTSPAEGVEAATEIGAAIDKIDPYWVAGLLRDGRWDELARVRGTIAGPVCAGTTTRGPHRLWRAVVAGAADVLLGGLALCGGISGALKTAELAQVGGIRVSLGAGATLISLRAAAQVSFARGCVSPLRVPAGLYGMLVAAAPDTVRDGFILPGDSPGLGLCEAWTHEREPVAQLRAQDVG